MVPIALIALIALVETTEESKRSLFRGSIKPKFLDFSSNIL